MKNNDILLIGGVAALCFGVTWLFGKANASSVPKVANGSTDGGFVPTVANGSTDGGFFPTLVQPQNIALYAGVPALKYPGGSLPTTPDYYNADGTPGYHFTPGYYVR